MIRYVIIAAIMFCGVEVMADVTLYSQAPNFFDFGGATSVEPLPISADDFTPTGVWLLNGATLQGAWSDDNEPIPPGTTTRSFRIQFYEDNGGFPSELPFEDLSLEALIGNPQSHPDGFTIYDVSVTIPAGLLFSHGTNYWFAAVDEGPGRGGSDGFFWSNSADGDDDLAQKGDGGWQLFEGNLGFSLVGTVIPEPGSGTLAIVAGIVGSLWNANFRRQRAIECAEVRV